MFLAGGDLPNPDDSYVYFFYLILYCHNRLIDTTIIASVCEREINRERRGEGRGREDIEKEEMEDYKMLGNFWWRNVLARGMECG